MVRPAEGSAGETPKEEEEDEETSEEEEEEEKERRREGDEGGRSSMFDQTGRGRRVMEIANIQMEGGRLVAVGMLYGHLLFWNTLRSNKRRRISKHMLSLDGDTASNTHTGAQEQQSGAE